ncbi:MAG: hypothetical protein K0R67_2036 [Paenibacillus sp.]|jgi:hypothetical protein|nr:hypothetical protein [Paenibacillus sp.]
MEQEQEKQHTEELVSLREAGFFGCCKQFSLSLDSGKAAFWT